MDREGWLPIDTLRAAEDDGRLDDVRYILLWNPCDGLNASPTGVFLDFVYRDAREGTYTHWRVGPDGPATS